jgi:hypothetical protein
MLSLELMVGGSLEAFDEFSIWEQGRMEKTVQYFK